MKTKAVDNTKLGLFVLAGAVFLIITLYLIGKNRSMFGATFTIKASMSNVNGLMPGNNVRFKGIDVGTVKKIAIENDTSIFVVLVIDDKMRPYIRQNAIASIGTDGLMGNKLVNINSQAGIAPPVKEGTVIASRNPIETDEMLRTLNTTNNAIERITYNLQEITGKLNNSNSLWNLLSDSLMMGDLKNGVSDFRAAGSNTAELTSNARDIVQRFGEGDGIAGTLFTDTSLTMRLDHSLIKIQEASEKTATMIGNLESVIGKIKEGEGTAGLILTDTAMRNKLMRSAAEVEQGTSRFNENMEALKSNWLFRGYFKKQEKKQKKETPVNSSKPSEE